ncbi:myotubularin-like isoform X2 [Corticium candelabrum]|uniref:myotubularin-like isoform X2 n=1 Tax=Corticium candelabrum TaxID=121492 RepID=UPI002E2593E2|nr:myotubularin-like isoform X2 [Corticium candelabrum]
MRHCPIFLLFLDCVYQLTCQYPTAFEFSEFLLQHLWSTSYSCLYGSFLFDCEKEHLDVISLSSLMSTSGRMKSAWEDVSMSENSKNPLYGVVGKESQFSSMLGIKPEISDHDYLQPNVSIAALRFWSSCYLRWIPIAHSENGEQLSAVSIQQLVVEEIDWLLRRPCGDIALAQIVHNAKSESPAPLHEPYHDQPSSVRSRAMTMPTLRPESRSKTNVARGSYNSFLDDMSIRSFSMGNFAEEVFSMVERTSSLALKDGGVVPTMEASHSASKKSIDSNAVYV